MEEIDYDGETPVWRQVYEILRGQIEDGSIPPGRPIPSKKTVSQQYGVAGNTVEKAVHQLKADGLVVGVQGRGVFVRRR